MTTKEFTDYLIELRLFIRAETRKLLYHNEYKDEVISRVVARLWKTFKSNQEIYGDMDGLKKLIRVFTRQACVDATRGIRRNKLHSFTISTPKGYQVDEDETFGIDYFSYVYEPFPKIDLKLDIEKALSHLPGKMNSIAKLIMEGYTHKERANLLGITLYHEKQLVIDMKNNLKRILTAYKR